MLCLCSSNVSVSVSNCHDVTQAHQCCLTATGTYTAQPSTCGLTLCHCCPGSIIHSAVLAAESLSNQRRSCSCSCSCITALAGVTGTLHQIRATATARLATALQHDPTAIRITVHSHHHQVPGRRSHQTTRRPCHCLLSCHHCRRRQALRG